ncbi:MAG: hypothetical protein AUK44_02435 [Porphyromonadaceae bacterium CG2_30_38_12]|nr:MAG: hypothetical protein AUK44_02435 [Porphyromonadaceae bacterium CG2_30_38_12]
MSDGLKKKMINGLAWSSVNVYGVQFIQLIVGILLARILHVEEFGQIGILFFFVGISTVLIDGGFGQALIRKQQATQTDISTIFFLNLFLSVVLYLVLFLMAPHIANFFGLPALTSIARVLFITVIIFALYFIQQVQLLKKLAYKSNAFINLISVAISGFVALFLAFKGYGVWVLVYQQLSFHTAKAILSPFFLRWKPTFVFSWTTVRESWRFSAGIFAQTLLNSIFNNIYTLLIGKLDTIKNVGYFTQANKYNETVNVASNSILSAGTFPIFSQVQDDQPRLLRIYRRLVTSVSMLTFPFAAFLIIAAKPLIITLISEKWMESIVLFQLLIFSNIFYPIYTINVSILNARGESKHTLQLEILKKTLIVISILITFSYGIRVMLMGLIVANFIAFGASAVLIKQSLNHYFRHQLLDIAKTMFLVIGAALVGYFAYRLGDCYFVQLLAQGFVFFLLYLLSLLLVYPQRVAEVKQGLMKKIRSQHD